MENADLRKTKQKYIIRKVLMRTFQTFIEFESLCQKLSVFMSNFGIFYDARSPNMVMSRDPRSKFRKKFTFPDSAFNIGKSCKRERRALCFRSYQPKTSWGGWWKTPPSAFRVNTETILDCKIIDSVDEKTMTMSWLCYQLSFNNQLW